MTSMRNAAGKDAAPRKLTRSSVVFAHLATYALGNELHRFARCNRLSTSAPSPPRAIAGEVVTAVFIGAMPAGTPRTNETAVATYEIGDRVAESEVDW